jgi:hypothetical protein
MYTISYTHSNPPINISAANTLPTSRQIIIPNGSGSSSGSNGTILNPSGNPYFGNMSPTGAPSALSSSAQRAKGIKYVIVKRDGTRVELEEQQKISLREMIGICKFINAVSIYGTSPSVKMEWSALIKNLNIENHFKPAPPRNSDYAYVVLDDPL